MTKLFQDTNTEFFFGPEDRLPECFDFPVRKIDLLWSVTNRNQTTLIHSQEKNEPK